jgi:hypothetical protein
VEAEVHVITTLYDIQKALGRIEQKVDDSRAWQDTHATEDKTNFAVLDASLENIKLAGAKQKGFLTAVGGIAAVLGSGVGYLVEHYIVGRN